ncbi:hypothetical protein [Methanolapillus millepedarum]|uniref:hypothetical protein n=1 Tax=Methanolapillus millepedarum TaxID=3028296 RepID=UPI0030B8AE70
MKIKNERGSLTSAVAGSTVAYLFRFAAAADDNTVAYLFRFASVAANNTVAYLFRFASVAATLFLFLRPQK